MGETTSGLTPGGSCRDQRESPSDRGIRLDLCPDGETCPFDCRFGATREDRQCRRQIEVSVETADLDAEAAREVAGVCRCWTCGARMGRLEWVQAPREPSNDQLRVCPECHWAIEMLPNARQVANMIRYVAGLPLVPVEDCGPRSDDVIVFPDAPRTV